MRKISGNLSDSWNHYGTMGMHASPVQQCYKGLHLIMHRTIGLTGNIGPLTLVRSSVGPIVHWSNDPMHYYV